MKSPFPAVCAKYYCPEGFWLREECVAQGLEGKPGCFAFVWGAGINFAAADADAVCKSLDATRAHPLYYYNVLEETNNCQDRKYPNPASQVVSRLAKNTIM